MAEVDDFNAQILTEFRSNKGTVGGRSLLLLHSTGAKSGEERVHPVVYQVVGEHYPVFASYAGGGKNPAWFHNLLAHPNTTVEVGVDRVAVTARVTAGAERDTIWATQKALYPNFADYEQKTDRQIPVVMLDPRG